MADLYYVMGASGAGKDSIIRYIREKMPEGEPVVFAHRYITRPADAGGENHVALPVQEFLQRQTQGCFTMDWFSHDTHYGIGNEVNEWLSVGLNVVLNGSRAYLDEALARYPDLVPVLISVKPDILHARLLVRGRENEQQILKRLVQAIHLEDRVSHPRLLRIENSGNLQDAGEHLLNAILDRVNDQCA